MSVVRIIAIVVLVILAALVAVCGLVMAISGRLLPAARPWTGQAAVIRGVGVMASLVGVAVLFFSWQLASQ